MAWTEDLKRVRSEGSPWKKIGPITTWLVPLPGLMAIICWFSWSSFFRWMYTLQIVAIAMGCLFCWMLSLWFRRNVIGLERFLFLGEAGDLCWSDSLYNWNGSPTKLRLKIRIGGYFRECEIIGDEIAKNWSVETWDGETLTIRDHYGVTLSASYRVRGSDWVDLMKFMTRHETVYASVKAVEELQDDKKFYEDRVITLRDQLAQVTRERDALGTVMSTLLNQIKADRQTMGRSKHAQAIREALEAVITVFPEEVQESWGIAPKTSNNLVSLSRRREQAAIDSSEPPKVG